MKQAMSKVISIPVAACVSLGNVRQVVVDADLKELASRMDEFGQERPIDLYPGDDGQYIILHGHRRHAAAALNGWETIEAIIRQAPKSADEAILRQYFDNETAVRLTFLEKAQAYQALKDMGWSQQEIAAQFKVSNTTVSQALAALKAHPKLKDALNRGRISPSAIEPLLSLSLEEQGELADAAILRKTAAGVTDLVRTHKGRQSMQDRAVELVEYEDPMEDADPLEELAVEDLEEALHRLQQASQSGIQHPALRRKARPTVRQLVQMAQALDNSLQE